MNVNSHLKKIVSIFALLILSYVVCSGQQFLNLGFEYLDQDSLPKKWIVVDEHNTELQLKENVMNSGKHGIQISSKDQEKQSLFCVLNEIDGNLFIHRNLIKIGCYLKGMKNAKDSSINIVCKQFDGTGKELASDDYDLEKETRNDWMIVYKSFNIKSNSKYLAFGVNLLFNGSFYIDRFEVYIDGIAIKDSKPVDVVFPTQADKFWLGQSSFSIANLDENANTFHPLANILKDKKIIALGEVTHGAKEVYQTKMRLVQYLVNNLDFTILAMEMDEDDANILNNFILFDQGNARDALEQTGYWPWKTEEFLELVVWMNNYNKRHSKKIRIKGFDISFSPLTLSSLKVAAEKIDELLLSKINKVGDIYNLDFNTLSAGEREQILQKIDDVKNCWVSRKKNIIDSIDNRDVAMIDKNISHLITYIQFQLEEINQDAFRDRKMAENLIKLIESESHEKIIVWAHNYHISRDRLSMVGQIDKTYNLFSVAFALGVGQFTGIGIDDNILSIQKIQRPISDSYELFFAENLDVASFIDLQSARKKNNWISKNHLFRFIGIKYARHQFSEINLVDNFNSVIFIPSSTPSHLIF